MKKNQFNYLILFIIFSLTSTVQANSRDRHGTICRFDIKEKTIHRGKCFLKSYDEKLYYISGRTLLRNTGLKGITVTFTEQDKNKMLVQAIKSSGQILNWGIAMRSPTEPGCYVGLNSEITVCSLSFRPKLY